MSVRNAIARGLRLMLWFCVWVVAIVFFMWESVVVTSYLTARHYAPGETPQHMFYVALLPGADGAGFDTADLRELARKNGTYLLPRE